MSPQQVRSSQGENRLQTTWRAVGSPLAKRMWNIEQIGYDRLPAEGPAILCPNHLSFIDSAFLSLTMNRSISFVGKAEYMDSWKTKYVFPALGMIPIDRAGGSKSQAALDVAEKVLRRGELFAIYPEGTRSRDGALYKGRTGAARLAMRVGCPIYPVGITGTDLIQPRNASVPKLGKTCTIQIGRPIRPERYMGRGPEHMAWRSMIDEVMFEISQMTGQTYKNVYSGEPTNEPAPAPSRVATMSDEASHDTVDNTGELELVTVG